MPGLVTLEGKLSLVNWTDGAVTPTLEEVRAETKTRRSNRRSDYYQTSKCVEKLKKLPYLGEDLTNLFNDVESVVKKTNAAKLGMLQEWLM